MRPESSRDDRLARHRLPQSTLSTPLFAGVEAPVVGFELGVLVVVIHLVGLRWLPLLFVGLALAALHVSLALATRADRRLSLVFGRSLRAPRSARPWPTLGSPAAKSEPTFPRRLLP